MWYGGDPLITNAGLQLLLDFLDGDLTHIGLDHDAPTDAGLTDEYYRNTITPPVRDGNTSIFEIYLDETQGNGHIGGIGILSQATSTPGSGTLFGFSLANIDKASNQSLTISIEITVEGVS